jgi:hypothetical protein
MNRAPHAMRWWSAVMLVAVMHGSGSVVAASGETQPAAGRVPKPTVDAGRGEKCVADTDFMRRNHMKLLLHQRDETVHDGIRGTKFTLNGCIECHASIKNRSVIGSNQNFCQGCHSYAAVNLDCFECHASSPKAGPAAASGDKQLGAAR